MCCRSCSVGFHAVSHELTFCGVLTALIEIFVGVPADQGILCVVINQDTWPILQVIHTLTSSSKRQSVKCEFL